MIRLGIIRGGNKDRKQSLEGGKFVLDNLPEEFRPTDIYVDKEGEVYIGGMPARPETLFSQLDLAWSFLNDREFEQALSEHNLPLVGRYLPLGRAFVYQVMKNFPLRTAHGFPLTDEATAEDYLTRAHREISGLLSLRRLQANDLWGMSVPLINLLDALNSLLKEKTELWLEEHIGGKPVSVAVVEGLRGEPIYAGLPVNTISQREIFLYPQEKYEAVELSRLLHKKLGAKDYSESHFILHPNGRFYFSGFNTQPALSPKSSFIRSLAAVGVKAKDFIRHLVRKVF